MSLDVIKDLLGLLGGVTMAVPFFRDFLRRRQRDDVRELRPVFTPFVRALDKAEMEQTGEMERASRADLLWMLIGLALLIASFAVSLYIGTTRWAASSDPAGLHDTAS
jgi:hypothetical protein